MSDIQYTKEAELKVKQELFNGAINSIVEDVSNQVELKSEERHLHMYKGYINVPVIELKERKTFPILWGLIDIPYHEQVAMIRFSDKKKRHIIKIIDGLEQKLVDSIKQNFDNLQEQTGESYKIKNVFNFPNSKFIPKTKMDFLLEVYG